jgi:hypothetical protein
MQTTRIKFGGYSNHLGRKLATIEEALADLPRKHELQDVVLCQIDSGNRKTDGWFVRGKAEQTTRVLMSGGSASPKLPAGRGAVYRLIELTDRDADGNNATVEILVTPGDKAIGGREPKLMMESTK